MTNFRAMAFLFNFLFFAVKGNSGGSSEVKGQGQESPPRPPSSTTCQENDGRQSGRVDVTAISVLSGLVAMMLYQIVRDWSSIPC